MVTVESYVSKASLIILIVVESITASYIAAGVIILALGD